MTEKYWATRPRASVVPHGRGTTTALLLAAREAGIASAARVCLPAKSFPWAQCAVVSSPSDIRAAAGSKFVYLGKPEVPGSMTLPHDCAVVGLPCEMQRFSESAGVLVSLFCGLNVLPAGLRRAVRSLGADPTDVECVDFRTEKGTRFTLRNGSSLELRERLWLNYFFCPDACVSCTDYLGRHADISVGDRNAGWNSAIARTERGIALLQAAVDSGYLEAVELSQREFLQIVMTPFVQKERLGGYKRFWMIRHRKWVRWLPVPVLKAVARRIYQQTVAESRRLRETGET